MRKWRWRQSNGAGCYLDSVSVPCICWCTYRWRTSTWASGQKWRSLSTRGNPVRTGCCGLGDLSCACWRWLWCVRWAVCWPFSAGQGQPAGGGWPSRKFCKAAWSSWSGKWSFVFRLNCKKLRYLSSSSKFWSLPLHLRACSRFAAGSTCSRLLRCLWGSKFGRAGASGRSSASGCLCWACSASVSGSSWPICGFTCLRSILDFGWAPHFPGATKSG